MNFTPRRVPEGKEPAAITLRIWDQMEKLFPGHNPPSVEILVNGDRLGFQVLNEVPWALDAWAETHAGHVLLYVQARHRLRKATGTYVYQYNPEEVSLEYKAVVFTKEELQNELEWNRL